MLTYGGFKCVKPNKNYIQTCLSLNVTHGSVFCSCSPSVRHDLHMSTCPHLIYHGDDLCNNPSVMKLVTQTAICYWFHANAFDSWWRLALALNGAVSWWVDSFVVIPCTLVQTDTDNVNNPVRAADDIYWALIFNLDNKCVTCVFIALLCTFFLPRKDFLSSAELLQESLGLFVLLFLAPHTLTAAFPLLLLPPFHTMSFI